MKKQQLRLWKQWKQQNKGTDPGNREKERRYRRNCRRAYLRYLFARLYLTTLGNYAMVILLEQFYSFRDYGSLPGDGFILGPHIIPMRTKSKEARGGCVWDPCVRRQETAGLLFLQTKTIREALGRKEQLMGKISCFSADRSALDILQRILYNREMKDSIYKNRR